MECFNPIRIRGSDLVPCGKCFACQSNRRKSWFFRLKYEMLDSLCSYTVTLTYDNDHLPEVVEYNPYDPLDSHWNDSNHYWYHPYRYEDVQLFFKRLRKAGYKFRYFGVAEYGSRTARPHYHIIFFFKTSVDKFRFSDDVFRQWPYGSQIKIDSTTDDCIGYTTKYCLKPYTSSQPQPKMFCSQGLGSSYLSFSKKQTLNYFYHNRSDVVTSLVGKQRIPRYYRDKFFTQAMRDDMKNNLLVLVDKKRAKDEAEALRRNITFNELIDKRRKAFTDRCLNSLKKSKL